MIRELLTHPRMISFYKKSFCTLVVLAWLFIAYIWIWWASEQIQFHRAMGGMF